MAITLADFTKIWASTSPLTPYSFSDSNYQEGWNFVGATPPARQMWDFLQKNNDEKAQFLANSIFKGDPLTLTADDGNGNTVSLVGDPNGSLTWNGKEVERVNASGSNYIRYESGLQLCWGLVSVNVNVATGTTPFAYRGIVTVTFPVAFNSTPFGVSNVDDGSPWWTTTARTITSTTMDVEASGNTSATKSVYWFAVANWK